MKIGALALALGAIWTVPAAAQMVEAKNPASVQSALTAAGYPVEAKKDTTGDPLFLIESQGYKMMVVFYGCKDNVNCKSVSLFGAFRANKKPDAEKINVWNRKNRWGRAFLDNEGDPALQFEIDLDDGGMSRELFIDNLEWFTVAFDRLKTNMNE